MLEVVVVAQQQRGDRIARLELFGADILCRIIGTNVGNAIILRDGQNYSDVAEAATNAVIRARAHQISST